MSYQFDSRLGKQLYQLLPEVYRTRDRSVLRTVTVAARIWLGIWMRMAICWIYCTRHLSSNWQMPDH